MDWPTSPAAQQAAAAAAGDPAAAARLLKPLAVVDALGACARVATAGGRAAFRDLARAYWATSAGLVLDRAGFALRVAEGGFVPAAPAAGVDALDYQFARQFILKVRDDPALVHALGWPPDPRSVAAVRPFYPDLVRGTDARRQRVCTVACAHRDKGPVSPQQWALFSLGSLYPLTRARSAARPSGGTTGVHFARSVLHAAGCNVIRPGQSVGGLVPATLFAALPRESFGYVPAEAMDRGLKPEPGDIFHIQGADGPDEAGSPRSDSTHVGVIIGVWGTIWLTIEGGAGDHVTRQRTRELVPVKSPYGKWAFKYDEAAAAVGVRPLRGWYSVARMRPDLWMNPPADATSASASS